jgi:hypothetical protein
VLAVGVVGVACSSGGSGAGNPADAGRDAATASPDAGADAAAEAGPSRVCMSDAGAPSASEFANVPTCMPHECLLTGTLNGGSAIQSYAPANDTLGGSSFDVDIGAGGHIHLTFSGSLATNVPDNAQGTLLTPSDWPYAPGGSATICAGDGTRIMTTGQDAGGMQVQFIMRCMSGGCDGGAGIDGELDGCCMP